MDEICEKGKCTGCCACLTTCLHSAIKMKEDECGFLYPMIDETKCINCGLCRKICPNNTQPEYHIVKKVFIACASDYEEQKTSASGGVASVFARQILRKGGIVYGCSGQNSREVKHIRIDDEAQLVKIKGSKYVQSYIGELFTIVKQDLEKGRQVLFVATPCIIAGLNACLKKKYKNLITVDLVCHGVPSQKILNSALDSYPNIGENDIVNFRKKGKTGKVSYGLFVKNKSDFQVLCETFPNNLYITGFLQGLFYRASCYVCHYACCNRVADITLGDYWDKHGQFLEIRKKNYGLSMVLLNTDSAITFWKECGHLLKNKDGDLKNVIQENGQLSHPMPKHINYELFKKIYVDKGFVEAAKKSLESDIKILKRHLLVHRIVCCFYKIPGVRKLYYTIRNR